MKQQTGLFWHVHHEKLLEWCHNYDERVAYIQNKKPEEEQETRLRLFKPVKGKLPQEVVKASQEYDKARQELNKARQELNKAMQENNKAAQENNKAARENDKAWQEYDKARQEYSKALNNNKELIEALHKAECPNCPWNGRTIFPAS